MKKVLLAVCGLAPQVITEALYALFHEGREVHSVQVITTRKGKEAILARMLAPEDGRLAALLSDCGIARESVDFFPRNIHTLKTASGAELDDIITPEDNEILLQLCFDLAFRHTGDPDCAVYFLVAGGRKTMTSCLTLAAQLYGRPQDRIFHVLVSPEFENCRDFWFPPRNSAAVELRDEMGQPYWKETRYARLHLITIPFVSVREQLTAELLDRPRPPAELMQALIRDSPRLLVVNLAEGKLIMGRAELDMHPAWLALYAFFAGRKKDCRLTRACHGCTDCFLAVPDLLNAPDIAGMYERIVGHHTLPREVREGGIAALSKENSHSYKSKIRQALCRAFGRTHAGQLEIAAVGDRPESRYGLKIDRHRIRMEW